MLTIGNAIVDVLAHTEEDFLVREGLVKGSMRLIDGKEADRLFGHMGPTQLISGGCAGNTAAGVASFGGRAAFIGKVADDELGQLLPPRHACARHPFPDRAADRRHADGALDDPDHAGQRAHDEHLSRRLPGADARPTSTAPTVEGAAITYLEGYLWDPPKAKEAFRIAAEDRARRRAQGRDHALRLLLRRPLSRRVHRADADRRARHRLRQPARGAVALPDQRFRDGGRMPRARHPARRRHDERGGLDGRRGRQAHPHPGGEGRADRRPDRRRRPLRGRLPLRPVARLSARGLRPARLARGGRGDLATSARGRSTRSGSSPARRVLRPEPSDILPRLADQAPPLQKVARLPERTGCAARRGPECCRDRGRSTAGTGCAARRSRSPPAPTGGRKGRARGSRPCRRRPACWPEPRRRAAAANPIAAISAAVARSEPREASRSPLAAAPMLCSYSHCSRSGVSRCEPGT